MITSALIRNFEPVDLDDEEHFLIRNRYDTKYLFSPELLKLILGKLTDSYQVLNINNHYLQDYESLYFDNEYFKFYLDHHNGKLNRYKVRFRKYLDSKRIFVEIKFKNNKNQTIKWRKKINKSLYLKRTLTNQEIRFINTFLRSNPGRLFPRFTVAYSRLALIHKKDNERVTIDLDLSYLKGHEEKIFKNISIAEVKQETFSQNSPFFKVMREFRIMPMRFSKYCFGIYQFYPVLKYNRFKPRYLFIERKYNSNLSNKENFSG